MDFIIGIVVFFFGWYLLFTGEIFVGAICILVGASLVTGKEGGD